MKLQLSCDFISVDHALSLVKDTREYIDIIEMGTPFILKNGIRVARTFKDRFPQRLVLADMKIMDGGFKEAKMAFENGADIVTVLAVASKDTILQVIRAAKEYGRQVMVDLIQVENIKQAYNELAPLGPDGVCVHTAVDNQQYDNPLEELRLLQECQPEAEVAVAGGIKLANIDEVIALCPDIVVVGGGITRAANPLETVRKMKNRMASVSS